MLTGTDVTERTDTVMKMANVTGESASDVSSYMTAIWNNFDDGSESLEHYADVITNLGAHTASSSEEIAEGLEKFASIGNTVGLSYDYATSALATVVAQTRQSADTVGTAFKTLFGRIQDLELGETAEDGTTLGTYSKALEKIGVNIKDDSGEIKSMNTILDEMGEKWQTISKDEQIAVAQAVGGTRQYAQLIALMDNWDSFQENLGYAEDSDGTLQKQADIYAESWDAAQKRVKASLQGIFDDLIDDNFFIGLTDGLADFIGLLDKAIDAIGGLKSIVPLVTTALLGLFGDKLTQGIDTFIYNLNIGTEKGKQSILDFREEFSKAVTDMNLGSSPSGDALTFSFEKQAELQQAIVDKQRELIAQGKDFTEVQKLQNRLATELLDSKVEEYQKEVQIYEEKNLEYKLAKTQMENSINKLTVVDGKSYNNKDDINKGLKNVSQQERRLINKRSAVALTDNGSNTEEVNAEIDKINAKLDQLAEKKKALNNLKDSAIFNDGGIKEQITNLENYQQAYEKVTNLKQQYDQISADGSEESSREAVEFIQSEIQALEDLGRELDSSIPAVQQFQNAIKEVKDAGGDTAKLNAAFDKLTTSLEDMSVAAMEPYETLTDLIDELASSNAITKDAQDKLNGYVSTLKNEQAALIKVAKSQTELNNAAKAGKDAVNGQKAPVATFGQIVTETAQSISSLTFAMTSLTNLGSIWTNDDLSDGEKFLQTITAITMAIPMLKTATTGLSTSITDIALKYTSLSIAKNADTLATASSTAATVASNAVSKLSCYYDEQEVKTIMSKITAEDLDKVAKGELTAAQLIQNIASKEGIILDEKQIVALDALIGKELAAAAAAKAKAAADKLAAIASKGHLAAILAIVAVIGVAAVTAYKAYQKSLENTLEASTKSREIQEELVDKYKETADSISELSDSIHSLTDDFDSQTDSLDSLRDKVFDLCVQYGQAELAAKALGATSVDALNNLTNEVEIGANQDVINSSQQEQELAAAEIGDALTESAGGYTGRIDRSIRYGKAIDLKGMTFRGNFTTDENDLEKDLEELAGGNIITNDKLDYDAFLDLAKNNRDELEEILANNNSKAAAQLRGYLSDMSDALDAYEESVDTAQEYTKKNILLSHTSGIKDLASYEDALNAMITEATDGVDAIFQGEDAEQEAYDYFSTALAGVDEAYQDWAQTTLVTHLLENIFKDSEFASMVDSGEVSQYVSEMTDAQRAFFGTYSNIVEDAANNSEDIFNQLQEQAKKDAAQQQLGGTVTNLANRIVYTASQMREAGWTEAYDGWSEEDAKNDTSAITTFTATRGDDERGYINVTPILPNGEILSPKGLDEYADKILNGEEIDSDVKIQIGGIFDTEEAAEIAAKQVHLTQEALTSEIDQIDPINALEYLYSKSMNYSNELSNSDNVSSIMTSATEDNKLDTDSLYSGTTGKDFQNTTGLNQEQFEAQSYGYQQLESLDYYRQKQEWLEKNRDAAQEEVAAEEQAYEERANGVEIEEQYKKSQEDLTTIRNNLINTNKNYNYSIDAINQALIDQASGAENVTEQDKNVLDAIEETNAAQDVNTDSIVENTQKYNKYHDTLDEFEALQQSVADSSYDVAKAQEIIADVMDDINGTIDDCQTAYQTLNSAVDEYNKNGYLSLDTVQSLIGMDSQYLSALDMQGDTLSVNTSLYEQLTIAKLEEMKAAAYETLQADLEAIAQNKLTTASNQASQMLAGQAQMEALCGNEASAAIPKIEALAVALSSLAGASLTDAQQQATDNAVKAYYNRINLINGQISQVKAGNYGKVANSSGSGSSGSGGSSKEKEVKDYQESEIDVYHDVERAIKEVADALDILDKKQEHLYGSELIASLQAENDLLEEQVANYTALGEVIDSELGRQQGELMSYGVSFDAETGEMTNYASAYNSALATYNAAIAAYNASAQEEGDKTALENAQKSYETFTDLIDEYDDTLDKRMENEQNKLDAQYQIIENNYTAWETEIQVKLDLSEAKQDWNKFFQKVKSDIKSAFKDYTKELANATTNFNEYSTGTVGTDLQAVNDIKAEIDKIRSGVGSEMYASESEAANDLLEKSNTLREDAESLYEIYTDAWDSYLDSIDQIVDKWEDLIDEFDAINDSLEHNLKVVELLYGEGTTAKQSNAQIYEMQNQNTLAEMTALRASTAAYEKERQELLDAGAKETDEDVQKLTEAIQSNEEEMENVIEDYLQGLSDQFINAVDLAMENFESAMTNGVGYDTISQHWDDTKEAAEGYYDEVERIYELEIMENKWESAINSTSSLKNQQKLKDLMDEQLASLEGKTKLSEYDIQLAEKQLAVAQAQIALDEAQNSKSTMKLTRNESGNWTYQYVSDDEDVASKQQSLMDAYNEWYEFAKTSSQEIMETIIEYSQEYQERVTELMEEASTADAERRAEIEEELQYLADYYYGEDGLITTKVAESAEYQDNVNIATMNTLWDLYEQDEANYAIMTDDEKALIDGLREDAVDQYKLLKEAVAGEDGTGGYYGDMREACEELNKDSLDYWKTTAADVINAWYKDPDSVSKNIASAYSDCKAAQATYDKAVEDGVKASGVQYTNLGTQLDTLSSKIETATNKTDDLVAETDNISDAAAAVESLRAAWEDVCNQIEVAIADLENYLSILSGGGTYTGTSKSKINATGSGSSSANGSGSSSGSGSGSGSGGSGGSSSNETYVYASSASGAQVTRYTQSEWDAVKDKHKTATVSYSSTKFASGGYTGDWNDGSGKLAVLHSKELVLNADDTKNMLSAVSAIREISSLGTSVTSSISNGISNLMANMLNLKSADFNASIGNGSTSNNNFDITMNVDGGNVEEIKTAILSLPTLASQYLSKNLK